MSRHGRTAGMFTAALIAVAAGGAQAAPAPEPGATSSPAPAAADAASSSTFSVKRGSCQEFLALAADVRGLVVAWTAGHYHTLDRWVMDASTARKVVAGVEQECAKTPSASFRYKVVEEVSKLK